MIRSKGEAGTGDVSEAVKHLRSRSSRSLRYTPWMTMSRSSPRQNPSPQELVKQVAADGKLPVEAYLPPGVSPHRPMRAMMMQLGADGVSLTVGIFHSENPTARARAIVTAVQNYKRPRSSPMPPAVFRGCDGGSERGRIFRHHTRLAERGW